ncbi:MAG TPA: hypothetical protein VJQ79_05930 [Acidimicrobiia bacterium]|nr:hypothetical protein [Acidimicrobiia bacterium]
MAFDWAKVLVAPTASSGLTNGTFAAVDEPPPWSDADECYIQLGSLASGTFIFSGFNMSLGPGAKKGFWIHWRCDSNSTEGFNVTITVKQGTTTLWTSSQFPVTQGIAKRTYQIRIPDSAFASDPAIDNMSIEFASVNLRAANQRLRTSWCALSKSPFTVAQEAVLPPTLAGQDFTCFRASDLGLLGAVDAENLFLIPDASGNGRHLIMKTSGATYETDPPVGFQATTGRFLFSLGYDPAAGAITTWTGNKIFHFCLYPTSIATESAFFSTAATTDFIGVTIPGQKHILGLLTSAEWVMMSGDGTGPAHIDGGSIATSVVQRITEWVQVGGGNEHMWEEDDASPIIDASSGDNPFYSAVLLDRESDDRPFSGRGIEAWFIEGTGVTEAEIDAARKEWVNGPPISTRRPVSQLQAVGRSSTF